VETPSIDGRTARRDRNRVAVLDTVLEMFSEGDLDPKPEIVAARSGVSLRSVYRYVTDRDELVRTAIARHVEKVQELFVLPDLGEGPLDDRIDRFVESRLTLYDAIVATHRAARSRAPVNPLIRERLEASWPVLREQVEAHFAVEFGAMPARDRRHVVAAVDALTQIETIEHLRAHSGLPKRAAHHVLVDALTRLLAGGTH
jgi:AcrR family transcriptional regulator